MNYASPTKFNTCLPFKSRLCHELDLVAPPTWPLLAGFDRFWRNFIRLLDTKRPFLAAQAGHGQAKQAADRVSAHAGRCPFLDPGSVLALADLTPSRVPFVFHLGTESAPLRFQKCSKGAPQLTPIQLRNGTKRNIMEHYFSASEHLSYEETTLVRSGRTNSRHAITAQLYTTATSLLLGSSACPVPDTGAAPWWRAPFHKTAPGQGLRLTSTSFQSAPGQLQHQGKGASDPPAKQRVSATKLVKQDEMRLFTFFSRKLPKPWSACT